MAITPLSFLTIHQIAERWNMDVLEVQQLLLTGKLMHAFLVSGPARIVRTIDHQEPEIHPLCSRGPLYLRLLVHAAAYHRDRYSWAFDDVQEVYECFADAVDRFRELSLLRLEERTSRGGWVLQFDMASTQIIGEDSFQLALRSLAETALISAATIADFERQQDISPLAGDEEATGRAFRDSRKQRCRAVAQILWERDVRATVPDLYHSEWIQRIACEGKPPSEKTFREWIKDLNPDRSRGRRAA